MSRKAHDYIDQGLAAAGIAILDSTIACTLRGDLWTSGMEAAGDFSPSYFRAKDRPGVRRFQATFKGLESRPVEVLARSADRLGLRIEWITGREVADLVEIVASKRMPEPMAEHLVRRPQEVSDDVFESVVTREAGRACEGCENISASGRCTRFPASGIERPKQRVLRRCVEFVPFHGSLETRTGRQLWPELAALEISR